MDRLRRIVGGIGVFSSQRHNAAPVHRSWKAVLSAVVSLCLVATFSACGGGSSSSSSSTDAVSISISPQSVTIPVSTSQQFSAAVLNASDTTVTWKVNGTEGGSSTYGTITTSGLYTAPVTVPSSAVTVTVVSKADTTKTASATVTLSNANTLSVSPVQVTVPAGGQQSFNASLGGKAVDATWSITCNTSGVACGTISSDGIYTAPLAPPPGRSVTVHANSTGANAATAAMVITFGNGSLIGPYTFAMTGVSGGQPYSSAGSVTFDGKGGITGGIEDISGGAAPVNITGGTYSVDAQGRVSATVTTDAGDESWQLTLVGHSRALVMRTDTVVARGDMDLQESLQFGNNLSGEYSFQLAGSSSNAIPVSGVLGAFTASGGNITLGVLDLNDGGTVTTNTSFTGTSTASSAGTGRGTLTLGGHTLAYYTINSTSARMIATSGTNGFVGKLVSRVASNTVDASYFQGNYAFVFSGADSNEAVAQGGTFAIDRSGIISSGVLDRSSDSSYSLGFLVSGSLDVTDARTGRSVVTLSSGAKTWHYVVYPPSSNYENSNKYGVAFLQIDSRQADTDAVTTGVALQQQGTVYNGNATSFAGQFALAAGEASGAVRRTLGGAVAIGAVATGALDLNDNGNKSLGTALQSSGFSLTSSGRGQFLLQAGGYSATYTGYIVDSGTVLLLETDGKGALTGEAQSQY